MADIQIYFTIGILILTTIMFTRSHVPIAITSVVMLTTLIVFFQLFPITDPSTGENLLGTVNLLEGFANPALVTVIALLIVGEGVTRTGSLLVIAKIIKKLSVGNWRLALSISLITVAILSAFLNNAPIVVIFMPILLALSKDINISPSKMLMPLSFVSILGGSCTLIGSSTNVLLADFVSKTGITTLNMFTFTSLGAILLGIGLIYLIFITPSLLPNKSNEELQENPERNFIAQLTVQKNSPLIGSRINDNKEKLLKGVEVVRVVRNQRVFTGQFMNVKVQPEDILILVGGTEQLKQIEWSTKSTLRSIENDPNDKKKSIVAEAIVATNSSLVGNTIQEANFKNTFGVEVIGIQRFKQRGHIHKKITDITIRGGDLLLLQGRKKTMTRLKNLQQDLFLMWGAEDSVINAKKSWVSVSILIGIVLMAMTPLANMLVLSMIGAVLMLLTKCITVEQAYKSIPPEIILLIGSTLALGHTMQVSGTSTFIANGITSLSIESPWIIMSLFGLIVAIFTNIISNNAAAILFAPIAISTAQLMGVSPIPFIMAVLFGANAAFSSPIGYKTNLLVMKAGGYKFSDFFKAGLPLNLIVWIVASILIPYFWPF